MGGTRRGRSDWGLMQVLGRDPGVPWLLGFIRQGSWEVGAASGVFSGGETASNLLCALLLLHILVLKSLYHGTLGRDVGPGVLI